MKNFLFILLLLLLFSCQNDKKEIKHIQKQSAVTNDSNLTENNKPIPEKVDSTKTTSKETKPIKNILQEEEKNSTYKMKSISELWKQYKSAKALATKYVKMDNLDSVITYLNIAADAAYELRREDIATWQLNNIGYHSIVKFKKLTDYDKRMQQLATFSNLRKKGLYTAETKSVFRENYNILTRAEDFLYKAQLLDSEMEKSDRTKAIENNLKFISWIGDYISNGSNITRKRSAE